MMSPSPRLASLNAGRPLAAQHIASGGRLGGGPALGPEYAMDN